MLWVDFLESFNVASRELSYTFCCVEIYAIRSPSNRHSLGKLVFIEKGFRFLECASFYKINKNFKKVYYIKYDSKG